MKASERGGGGGGVGVVSPGGEMCWFIPGVNTNEGLIVLFVTA